MNTIQYGNVTTQVDITKYIKSAETIPQTQEPGTVQNVEAVQNPEVPTGLETGVEARVTTSYDELKAALVSAKIPVTDENIKTAGLMIKSGIEVQKENIEAAADIKKQVEYIINHANEAAVTSITGDGIALDKVTMDILEEVIQQVNQKEDAVKAVSDDAVKVAMNQYISENDLNGKLGDKQRQALYVCVKSVMAQDLPVTTKNIQALLTTVDKAYEIGAVNEKIAISLIKKDQPLTLEAIYVAKYSSNASSDKTTKLVSDEAFKQLLPQIEKLIKSEGIENKEQAIKAARVLVENELPVTAENINKIIDIDQMQHKDINIERIVYEAAKNIKIDKAPMDIALDKVDASDGNNKKIEKIDIEAYKKNTQAILENISKYDDETIKKAIDTAETITLKDLQTAYEEKEQKAVQKYIEDNHLQEKLSPSQKQVLQLCVKNLLEQDLPVTTKNVQTLLSTVDKAYEIGEVNKNTTIGLIKKGQPLTLEAIYAAKNTSVSDSAKTTKPVSDAAFKQALPQIEKLIQAEGIENKEQAIKAARVLVENELPVSAENIRKVMDIEAVEPKDINVEKLVYEAAKNIKTDKEPMDIALGKVMVPDENNNQIDPETYKKNAQVILENISKYEQETTQKAVQKYIEDNHLQEKLSPSQKQVLQLCVKKLIEQDLPVTTKNIQALLPTVDKSQQLPQYADKTLKKDQDATEIITLKELQQVYEKIKQESLQKDEKEISEKGTEMVQETTEQLEKNVGKELKTVTAKRQLAEIRLRLTSESMTTLIKKGIEIDTLPLKEAVEELKSVESELYKASLSRVGAEPTTENITQMQDLYQKLENIKTISSPTYNKVMQADIPFTIEGLSEAELNLQLQQATASYEAAQTQPTARFGDSFSKVADQVEPLVTGLGLEASEENIRAAKILVKNNIEVTDENMAAIKLIDVKVDKVTTQLHPTIAANMIKDGFNIVQTDIDEVINYMNGFNKLLGEDLTDKIASYIYDMDQTGELPSSERETMIGIYRMLYTVEKTQGRATGFLFKNDMPLTLGNLMQAAKYYDRTATKKSDIDVNIDDAFGTLEEVIIPEKSIKAQLGTLQAATGQNVQNNQAQPSTVEYEQNIIDKFIEKASPDIISKIVKQYPDVETMPVETILKAMETVQEQNTDNAQVSEGKASIQTQEFVKNLSKLASVEPTTLLWMKNNQVPLTVSNIETIQNFMKDAFYFGEQIDRFSKQVKEKLGKTEGIRSAIVKSDLSDLKEGKSSIEVLEDLEKEVSKAKKEALDLPEQQRQSLWKQADSLEKAIQLQKQVQKDETLYQIPIQLSSGLTNMNLYVMNDKEGDGKLSEKDMKVFLSMKTETLGTVQIYMKLTDKNVSFQINTDRPEATKFLQANQMGLQANIEELGYMVGRMNYGQEQPKSPLQTQIQPQIKTSRSNVSNDGFEVVV